MKLKSITIVPLVIFILVSCAPVVEIIPTKTAIPTFKPTITITPLPTATSTPDFTPTPISLVIAQTPNSSATGTVNSYPPCAPPYNKYSYPVSTPILQLKISNTLTLKEYNGRPDIKEQESGCRYANRDRVHMSAILLSNSFHIIDEPIDDSREKIFVFNNSEKVFETQISQYVYSGLLQAWEYDNHWVIEFVTIDSDVTPYSLKCDFIDIVHDGISLKNENNYKDIFSFQLLASKPFYFFKRQDNTFGVNYDGNEIELDYDDVLCNNPHPGFDINIFQYQNMVMFRAEKDGIWHSVVIGVLNK